MGLMDYQGTQRNSCRGLSGSLLLTPLIIAATIIYLIWKALKSSQVTFHHSKSSITIQGDDEPQRTFADLCKSIIAPCRLSPFLFNGHLQTAGNLSSRRSALISYRRHIFEQEDARYPGTFAVDFVVEDPEPQHRNFTPKEFQCLPSVDCNPLLIIIHGLAGGSSEPYILDLLVSLIRQPSGNSLRNWKACVLISRGCSGHKLTSKLFYSPASTYDLGQFISWLSRTFPNRPLYAIGFSVGANILTRYLGEQGTSCPLRAAISISNPFDLHTGNILLRRSWIGRLYLRALGSSLKTLFLKHVSQLSLDKAINIDQVHKARYLHEFDKAVQLQMWGYSTVGSYYRGTSSVNSLRDIRIPYFAICSEDDPIAVIDAAPKKEFEASEYAVLCITERGGHIGWFELGGQRWIVRVITAFLQEMQFT